jgi:sortase A
MKKLGNILIIIGIGLLIFIIFAKVKTYTEQKKLVEEYKSLTFSEETVPSQESTPEIGETLGILVIPEIELKTPIVEGAGPENIRFAVGHLPSSSSIRDLGKKGQNFAIAGHRSYTFGQFFNRLDELNKGNEFILYAQNKVFTYKVIDKKIVNPSNIEVIYPIKGKSIVTLITCHPKNSDKQRLIIFGELVSEKELEKKGKYP